MDKFKTSLIRILYSSGVVKQSRELLDEDIIRYFNELSNERASFQQKADEFYGFEKEVKLYPS